MKLYKEVTQGYGDNWSATLTLSQGTEYRGLVFKGFGADPIEALEEAEAIMRHELREFTR